MSQTAHVGSRGQWHSKVWIHSHQMHQMEAYTQVTSHKLPAQTTRWLLRVQLSGMSLIQESGCISVREMEGVRQKRSFQGWWAGVPALRWGLIRMGPLCFTPSHPNGASMGREASWGRRGPLWIGAHRACHVVAPGWLHCPFSKTDRLVIMATTTAPKDKDNQIVFL